MKIIHNNTEHTDMNIEKGNVQLSDNLTAIVFIY